MIRALYSAASGMTAQQLNVDNIAHNIANANTAGFKTRRAQFQDLLYQSLVQPGAAAGQTSVVPTGLQLGLGTRAASNEIIFTQGDFAATSNPLDPQTPPPPDAQSVTTPPDATVSFLQPNQTAAQQAGQIQLAGFQNPA